MIKQKLKLYIYVLFYQLRKMSNFSSVLWSYLHNTKNILLKLVKTLESSRLRFPSYTEFTLQRVSLFKILTENHDFYMPS